MNQFLSPDPARLGRPDVPPCLDAVDKSLLEALRMSLRRTLPRYLARILCGIGSATWCATHRMPAPTGIPRTSSYNQRSSTT
jgi:hypothetical protein